MSEGTLICSICGNLGLEEIDRSIDFTQFSCPICGEFSLNSKAMSFLALPGRKFPGPLFSAWIRSHKERDLEHPKITEKSLDEISEIIPRYTPREKQILLLLAIENRTEFPGGSAKLSMDSDYTLAWAMNTKEFRFTLKVLEERGFIILKEDHNKKKFVLSITAKGWDEIQILQTSSIVSTQGFVAMWFDKSQKSIYREGMAPAISDAGYKPFRVDDDSHNQRIDLRILNEIKRSRFLVADVTGHRQGVYYEAGYAEGLGIPVIWSVQKSDLKKAHFDTRQFRHIEWETAEDLKKQLFDTICFVVGKIKKK